MSAGMERVRFCSSSCHPHGYLLRSMDLPGLAGLLCVSSFVPFNDVSVWLGADHSVTYRGLQFYFTIYVFCHFVEGILARLTACNLNLKKK